MSRLLNLVSLLGSIGLLLVGPAVSACQKQRDACRADAGCFGACPSPDAICDERSGQWVGCLNDDDCGGATPVCSPTTRACIACTKNADCSVSPHGPVCDVATGECHACVSSTDCASEKPVCSQETYTCVGCSSDDDCAMSPDGPVCDAEAGTCHPCLSAADCGGATPVCSPTTRACVGCHRHADCANSPHGEICDTATKTCRGCVSTAECGEPEPLCSPATHACVQCVTSADCSLVRAGRICDPQSFTCRGCTSHAECSVFSGTPSCRFAVGQCAPCTPDTEATACGGYSCDRSSYQCTRTRRGSVGLCSPCQADSECTPGSHCIDRSNDPLSSGRVCLPDTPAAGCGNSTTNLSMLPYSVANYRQSVDGTAVRYCGPSPSVSCEAILRYRTRCAAPGRTARDASCGSASRQDGVCLYTVTDRNICSYPCHSSRDCVAAATCTSISTSEDYCRPR